jgi:RNA 3'-terminal phosphate cyclase (ATP)
LLRYGFFPAGGGKIIFEIQSRQPNLSETIDLCQPIVEPKIYAIIYTAKLPGRVAQRQRELLNKSGLEITSIEHIEVDDSAGPGNCVVIRVAGNNRTVVFTGFGARGKPSEKVIAEAVQEASAYLGSGAGIDHYLADQLPIYMAMQKTGRFITNELSNHLTTNIEVIKKFLPVNFVVTKRAATYEICCRV